MIIQERKLSNKINYEVLHDLNIQAAQTDKEKIHGLSGSPADNEKNQKKEPTLNRYV